MVVLKSFRDGFFPWAGADVKEVFEGLKGEVDPDLVIVPHRADAHQDHRLVAELTWNTFRDHLVLEYEIPKYDGDLGNPNLFVPLPAATCQRKVELLLEQFPTTAGSRPTPSGRCCACAASSRTRRQGSPRPSTAARRPWTCPRRPPQ